MGSEEEGQGDGFIGLIIEIEGGVYKCAREK